MDNKIFSDFDFTLLDSPDFKEDSVREELILPILKSLGYSAHGENKIIRSKTLQHPFVSIGSKQTPLTNFPDYLFEVQKKYAWVLDAKSPDEDIKTGKNVEQTYFYAIHPEIRVDFYALCNGREFILFHISQKEALLYFPLSEIEKHWQKLVKMLAPERFISIPTRKNRDTEVEFDYLSAKPLSEVGNIQKQSSKRHYGIHGYFTKQSFQVVQAYIKNFTKPNDIVLDSFGGTGVTAIEALMIGRKAIHIDLNPLSIFFVRNLISPILLNELGDSFERVKTEFQRLRPKDSEEIEKVLNTYSYPKTVKMPKGSDFEFLEQAFSKQHLAELAVLKFVITQEKKAEIRDILLLMFSSCLNKTNLTYHASSGRTEGRGNSSIFAYYRYRKAPNPGNVDLWETFEGKLRKVVNAKKEILPLINESTIKNAQIIKGTATNLEMIETESVDYIYTDPPYGKKIQYLDLSIMWNAWLDLHVSEADYNLEAIEGGEHHKTKADYSNLIAQSIAEMYRVLKFDRWMSFVFQHQDPAYWHLIVETAEKCGFEYAGAVKQNNGQTSFKKRQNPFTVLSGQLIINFKKIRNPKSIMKADLGANVTDLIVQSIEGVIAKNLGATIEEINDELIIRGLELGFLDVLSKKYQDITPFLLANFDYDRETQNYVLRKNTKFKAQIPVELRIRFYVVSMLRRLSRENKFPHFDDIILEMMPLLKNGKTPDNQTILSVLEEIAVRVGGDSWKLKESGQQQLFDLI